MRCVGYSCQYLQAINIALLSMCIGAASYAQTVETTLNKKHVSVAVSQKTYAKPAKPWSLSQLKFDTSKRTLDVMLGAFFTTQGIKAQDINIQGLIGDRFTVTSQKKYNVLVGAGYYLDASSYNRFDFSYGVNVFYLARTVVNGDIYQEHMFNNLAYSYHQTNIPIYVAAKSSIKTKYDKLSVIFDMGIGPNIVQTSNFTEISLNGGQTLPDNMFSGATKVNFSAMAGLGLRLNQDWMMKSPFKSLECGYRYFYLGEGALNKKSSQILNTLDTDINYAQALVCTAAF